MKDRKDRCWPEYILAVYLVDNETRDDALAAVMPDSESAKEVAAELDTDQFTCWTEYIKIRRPKVRRPRRCRRTPKPEKDETIHLIFRGGHAQSEYEKYGEFSSPEIMGASSSLPEAEAYAESPRDPSLLFPPALHVWSLDNRWTNPTLPETKR